MVGLYGKNRFGARNVRPVVPRAASGELPHSSENLLCRHKINASQLQASRKNFAQFEIFEMVATPLHRCRYI